MERPDQMRKGTTTLAILKLLVDTGEPLCEAAPDGLQLALTSTLAHPTPLTRPHSSFSTLKAISRDESPNGAKKSG